MAGPAATLRELHRLRRYARDLETQIEREPKAIEAQRAKVTRQEELLRQEQDAIKKLKVANHEKEVSLRTRMQQIEKHERQLNEATAKKEYDALKGEIAHERDACLKLEDEILNGLMEVDERTARLPEMEKAIARAKDEAATFEASGRERLASLRQQLDEARAQLADVEGTLPDDVRAQYTRLLTAKGEDAMSAVQGRTCTACYTEITAQSYNELRVGQFVVCKNCGRILYLPE